MLLSAVSGKKVVADIFLKAARFYGVSEEEEGVGKDVTYEVWCVHDRRLLLAHGTAHVNDSMSNGRRFAKMQRYTGCRTVAAVQVVTRSESALSKSIELGSLQSAYSSYFWY